MVCRLVNNSWKKPLSETPFIRDRIRMVTISIWKISRRAWLLYKFVIILQNLIKAYHRKSGKSKYDRKLTELDVETTRAVARALIGGRGCIFIYSGSARLVSFEIKLISKEASRAEPEYMIYTPPPISVLATALETTRIRSRVNGIYKLLSKKDISNVVV